MCHLGTLKVDNADLQVGENPFEQGSHQKGHCEHMKSAVNAGLNTQNRVMFQT